MRTELESVMPRAKMGRPRGSYSKGSADIRRMVLIALENAGGAKYLERQANSNPVAFMGLLGKILPVQMQMEAKAGADGNAPVAITLSWLEPGKRFSGGWRGDPEALEVVEALDMANALFPPPPGAVDVSDLV